MDFSIGSDLFKIVKDHLRITWDYEDDKIVQTIAEAKAKIEIVAGATDFSKDFAIMILKNCSRYYWDGSAEFFEENFRRELIQLQLYNARHPYFGG